MSETAAMTGARRAPRLMGYALFAGMLAAAGLPVYIHAPKVYADTHGVSLAALGTVLFALRLIDVVQDPALGWLAGRIARWRGVAVTVGAAAIAGGMVGLFAVTPPVAPLVWFALMLTLVFSAFSFLTICMYSEGVSAADRLEGAGHLRLARWRETGALLGICAAATAPALLGGYGGFAIAFAALALVAWLAMADQWQGGGDTEQTGFVTVLRDRRARQLLLVALVNAAPVAITSTLFLFFVESRLAAPGWEGPYLVLFFLSAACAAPGWGALAERFGAKRMLLVAMVAVDRGLRLGDHARRGRSGGVRGDLRGLGRGHRRGHDAAARALCPAHGRHRTQRRRGVRPLGLRVEIHAGAGRGLGAAGAAGGGLHPRGRQRRAGAVAARAHLWRGALRAQARGDRADPAHGSGRQERLTAWARPD